MLMLMDDILQSQGGCGGYRRSSELVLDRKQRLVYFLLQIRAIQRVVAMLDGPCGGDRRRQATVANATVAGIQALVLHGDIVVSCDIVISYRLSYRHAIIIMIIIVYHIAGCQKNCYDIRYDMPKNGRYDNDNDMPKILRYRTVCIHILDTRCIWWEIFLVGRYFLLLVIDHFLRFVQVCGVEIFELCGFLNRPRTQGYQMCSSPNSGCLCTYFRLLSTATGLPWGCIV